MLIRVTLFSSLVLQLSCAQSSVNYQPPSKVIYFEIGGKFFYSANIDFPIDESSMLGFGLSPVYSDIVPTIMYYKLFGKKSNLELGGGVGYILYFEEDSDREDFKGFTGHGVIGYRYQKKNGLLFRIGFTPLYITKQLLPHIGFSIGYSFWLESHPQKLYL